MLRSRKSEGRSSPRTVDATVVAAEVTPPSTAASASMDVPPATGTTPAHVPPVADGDGPDLNHGWFIRVLHDQADGRELGCLVSTYARSDVGKPTPSLDNPPTDPGPKPGPCDPPAPPVQRPDVAPGHSDATPPGANANAGGRGQGVGATKGSP